eukprot:scaffold20823_cov130-Skeletonema_marinoi.AAC.2
MQPFCNHNTQQAQIKALPALIRSAQAALLDSRFQMPDSAKPNLLRKSEDTYFVTYPLDSACRLKNA